MRLSFAHWALPALLLTAACGGPERAPAETDLDIIESALQVWADPPGLAFESNTEVSLTATMPGAAIYFTRDGSDPSSDEAELYTGPIELDSSTLLSFIARDSHVWSPPKSEFYNKNREATMAKLPERNLWVEDDSIFFPAEVGSRDLVVRSVRVRSVGVRAVTIEHIVLGPNPHGRSFWNSEAFSYEILTDQTAFPLFLPPGEEITLEIAYTPTETFAGGAIFIQSDSDGGMSGEYVVEVWGRIVGW